MFYHHDRTIIEWIFNLLPLKNVSIVFGISSIVLSPVKTNEHTSSNSKSRKYMYSYWESIPNTIATLARTTVSTHTHAYAHSFTRSFIRLEEIIRKFFYFYAGRNTLACKQTHTCTPARKHSHTYTHYQKCVYCVQRVSSVRSLVVSLQHMRLSHRDFCCCCVYICFDIRQSFIVYDTLMMCNL